jgi:hypothetical protein
VRFDLAGGAELTVAAKFEGPDSLMLTAS